MARACSRRGRGAGPAEEQGGKKQTELPTEMLSCTSVKSMCGSTADVANYVP